jgi:hypothetical protein
MILRDPRAPHGPGVRTDRTEINVKLGQGQYAPAVKSDVAAVAGNEPALAQRIDGQKYPGLPPVPAPILRAISAAWDSLFQKRMVIVRGTPTVA